MSPLLFLEMAVWIFEHRYFVPKPDKTIGPGLLMYEAYGTQELAEVAFKLSTRGGYKILGIISRGSIHCGLGFSVKIMTYSLYEAALCQAPFLFWTLN